MDFKDYQKSSAKHLNTCQAILNSIDLLKSNSSAFINQQLKIQAVLHNVFYLSGYTLESIINYSIFKHFKWKEPSIYTTDHNFSAKCDVSFYPNTSRQKGGQYQFWLSQHEFQRNIQVLSKAIPNSKIPLIDRSVSVDQEVVKMFKSWDVEIRYHPELAKYQSIQLTENNVKKFVEVTDQVYNGLMKTVG